MNTMKLMSWGSNSYGQLGHGVLSEQCVVPTTVTKGDPKLNVTDILSISAGGGHTLILDKHGKVFSCGWNCRGQAGLQVDCKAHNEFVYISYLADHKITHICCGWESSYAITSMRTLLVWGSNAFGQLGSDKREIAHSSIPRVCPVPVVKTVAAGLRHCVILTENGNVMVSGNGRKGQLGLKGDDSHAIPDVTQPQSVPDVKRIKGLGCGQYHTVALKEDGSLLVWGDNKHGQLGLDPTVHPFVLKPTEVNPFTKEQLPSDCSIHCGWTHNLLVTGNGDIYNWGRNTYGQLGCSEKERPVFWKPEKMETVKQVKQAAVGSEHNLALLDSGDVVSWGWNEHGSCGTGDDSNVTSPMLVKINPKFKSVLLGAGGAHSFALVEEV